MRFVLALVLLAVSAGRSCAQQPAEWGRDLRNRPVSSLGDGSNRAVVLFFVATDCPISNRTFPEMTRLREALTAEDVRFWFVYPNLGEAPDKVRMHQRSFDERGDATDVILDSTGALSRMAGAKVTPEVTVLRPQPGPGMLAPHWTPVYTGRIDDRYVKLGLERPQITEHFAERVIREVLDGRPVEKPTGKLIGCGIVSPAPGAGLKPGMAR